MAAAGVEARALDLPGHGARVGEPDAEGFELGRVVEEVGAALERSRREAADRPVALLGYSMGGRIALHCALAYPELIDALVLESASPGLAGQAERAARRAEDETLAVRIEQEGLASFVDAWEALPLFASQASLPEAVRETQRRIRLANDPASLAASLRGLGTGALPSLWERLPEVRMPTLVLTGALDLKFVDIGARMAQAIPSGELRIVPGAGHTVHRERPREWAAAVGAFLSARTPTAP